MTTAQRIWKFLGQSSFYRNIGKLHTRLYRASGGRLGHATGAIRNLLLTTTGRKSGEARTCPLAYLRDGNRFVVIASNGGNDQHPAWYLNLSSRPRAIVEAGSERIDVVASTATGPERVRLWKDAVASNPQYSTYEAITRREIPVVVLTPAAG